MFLKHQTRILEWFLEVHLTLKTGVMAAEVADGILPDSLKELTSREWTISPITCLVANKWNKRSLSLFRPLQTHD